VKRANFLSSAKYLAGKAIEANPAHAEGYFCMSTALGLIALDASTREKVAASKDVRDYALKAIQYDPNHAGAWHILGGWNYNVANLSSFERSMGKLFFGAELDGASVEKALSCYNKALQGKPTFIRFLYDKAECLYSMKLYDDARKVLQTTLATKVLSLDDPMILDKARSLMGKLD
jgi:tetratricopeptide (TPR) repeat protein